MVGKLIGTRLLPINSRIISDLRPSAYQNYQPMVTQTIMRRTCTSTFESGIEMIMQLLDRSHLQRRRSVSRPGRVSQNRFNSPAECSQLQDTGPDWMAVVRQALSTLKRWAPEAADVMAMGSILHQTFWEVCRRKNANPMEMGG